MTGNIIIDLAISLGGIAFLLGISVLLGAWRTPPLIRREAEARLAFDEPDFQPTGWLMDEAGGMALATSEQGEIALVFRMGDNFATRRSLVTAVQANLDGEDLCLRVPGLARIVRLKTDSRAIAVQWLGVFARNA